MSALIDENQIQALVKRGYGDLPFATALIISFGEREAARKWLRQVKSEIPCAGQKSATPLHLGLTYSGLSCLTPSTFKGFPLEFVEGPTSDRSARALGDADACPAGTWEWGGPKTGRVDAILLIYSASLDDHLARIAGEAKRLLDSGNRVVAQIDSLGLETNDHFGFRDGLSQPIIDGFKGGPKGEVSPDDCIKPGEFVLGYENEYGKTEEVICDGRSFGINGTYLVVRQLAQDVPTFWREMQSASQTIGLSPLALASQIVGREPDGRPLTLAPGARYEPGTTPPISFRNAPYGACPMGAHVRRSHPRDAIPGIDSAQESIKISRNHRILRRGRRYGATLGPEEALNAPAGFDRGLLFMCLNASIRRQFEFVQQTWLNNPKFGGLYEDIDLIGGHGPNPKTFTVPSDPVSQRCQFGNHVVKTVGSGYFFLPSLAALDLLTG